ncbi:MAG TPA: hypothetical protein VNJ04_10390 [Gemmatimonadaceae bacterium]|nr:hypothetical protein [Gemmatimonadaceae bacterium]
MAIARQVIRALIGESVELPAEVREQYPELAEATYRRGGMPVRIGGWALGMSSVPAITLWRTVFLSPSARMDAGLLLHELRHVHQFLDRKSFPVSYLWQSIRYGYERNAYEEDARRYSAARIARDDSRKDS